MAKINLPSLMTRSEFIMFSGGSDTISPPVTVPPGFVRDSQNFEEDIYGGYASIVGYERFDGRLSPSSATYASLPITTSGTVAVGDTITGATSGATGIVLAITATSLIITKTTGVFVAETTTVGGAVITGGAVINGESGKAGAQYLSYAANAYRADIGAVPGSGRILGVWYYGGVVYAFRNNAGATAVGMYKSSASGWTAVNLGYEVYFTAGSGSAPAEGTTITQGAVTAVLKRVCVESGSWGASTAAGRLIFTTVTTGPFVAGAFSTGISATCSSQNTITIPNINGRFNFINANFYGSLNSLRMYGCDGANRGFEFDGTTFVPINTGMGAADKPTHVVEHQSHLFFSIFGAALHSAIGNPYNWTTTLFAGEIDFSDTITGFMSQTGDNTSPALAVYCRNKTYILYGSGASSWQLVKHNDNGGAIPYSIQKIGKTYVMDDRGVTSLETTQNFGNFAESTISKRVQNWINPKRSLVTDSYISRDKQQYRLFFSDGSAAYWTLGESISSMMPVYLPHKMYCSYADEIFGGGDEVVFTGSDNGFVYQMERGTSFDGQSIESYMYLTFNNSRSYRMLKKYRHLTFEVKGSGYAEFSSSYDLGYGSTDIAQPDYTEHTVSLLTPYWDVFTWDEFVWDGISLTSLSMATPGIADNISVKLISNGDYFSPIKFSGIFLEYSNLRATK